MVPLRYIWFVTLCLFGVIFKISLAGDPPTVYKVTTILSKPFTMIRAKSDKETIYEGFLIDILNALKVRLNVDFDIDLVVDGQYGRPIDDGNWTGMIGHLVRGEADIAAAPLSVVSTRAMAVQFTQQYMAAGQQILMKKTQKTTLDTFLMILQPFSDEVWTLVVASYVVVSSLLYAIWRWSPFEWGTLAPKSAPDLKESYNLKNSFYFTFSALMWQGSGRVPRSLSARILTATWWIFTMFLLVTYTAGLTGRFLIRTSKGINEIRTFDDLALSDLDYGCVRNGKTAYTFNTSKNPLRQKMWQKMNAKSLFVDTTDEGIKRVRHSGGNYAFILESPTAEVAASEKPCDLMVSGEHLTDNGYAFACQKNSSICNDLDHGLLFLMESEELPNLRRKWFGGVCAVEDEILPNKAFLTNTYSLNVRELGIPFVLLLIGIILTLVSFGLEIFLNRSGIMVPETYKEDEMRITDPSTGL